MTHLASTLAAERAQEAWVGIDAPAAEPTVAGLRIALANGLPGEVDLHDVHEWAAPALDSVQSARSMLEYEARFVGAIAAALILGAKLQETQGT